MSLAEYCSWFNLFYQIQITLIVMSLKTRLFVFVTLKRFVFLNEIRNFENELCILVSLALWLKPRDILHTNSFNTRELYLHFSHGVQNRIPFVPREVSNRLVFVTYMTFFSPFALENEFLIFIFKKFCLKN